MTTNTRRRELVANPGTKSTPTGDSTVNTMSKYIASDIADALDIDADQFSNVEPINGNPEDTFDWFYSGDINAVDHGGIWFSDGDEWDTDGYCSAVGIASSCDEPYTLYLYRRTVNKPSTMRKLIDVINRDGSCFDEWADADGDVRRQIEAESCMRHGLSDPDQDHRTKSYIVIEQSDDGIAAMNHLEAYLEDRGDSLARYKAYDRFLVLRDAAKIHDAEIVTHAQMEQIIWDAV